MLKKKHPYLLALFISAFVGHVSGATIVNETFADGERQRSQPPESLAWVTSQAAAIQVEDGALVVRPSNVKQAMHVLAHFTAQGAAVQLERNKPLKLTVEFTPVRILDGTRHGMRIGLFDSRNDVRFAQDRINPDVSYAGYAVSIDPAPKAAPSLVAYRRITDKEGRLLTNSGAFQKLTDGKGAQALRAGQRYTATLELALTRSDRVAVRLSIDGPGLKGYTIEAGDPLKTTASFDTVAFSFFQACPEVKIHRVQVTN